MSGTTLDPSNYPLCFASGLPALFTLWTALIMTGGADILMSSTAYGGSTNLTDLLSSQSPNIKKHVFDISKDKDF